jgi:hypothetical protein
MSVPKLRLLNCESVPAWYNYGEQFTKLFTQFQALLQVFRVRSGNSSRRSLVVFQFHCRRDQQFQPPIKVSAGTAAIRITPYPINHLIRKIDTTWPRHRLAAICDLKPPTRKAPYCFPHNESPLVKCTSQYNHINKIIQVLCCIYFVREDHPIHVPEPISCTGNPPRNSRVKWHILQKNRGIPLTPKRKSSSRAGVCVSVCFFFFCFFIIYTLILYVYTIENLLQQHVPNLCNIPLSPNKPLPTSRT